MSKLQGISVRLPLIYGKKDGPYVLNKNLGQVVRQNFKNLLLTAPGERIMIPEFGVGLYTLLFEQINSATFELATTRVYEQTKKYMPFVNIESIEFIDSDRDPRLPLNQVNVTITYNLGSLASSDKLTISSVTS